MDEILLTPREVELETERAIAAWNDSRPEQVPSREEFVLAWGCRAQVRKVVEQRLEPLLERTVGVSRVTLRLEMEQGVQALREAAGGEE